VRFARELFDLDDERRERWNEGGESE